MASNVLFGLFELTPQAVTIFLILTYVTSIYRLPIAAVSSIEHHQSAREKQQQQQQHASSARRQNQDLPNNCQQTLKRVALNYNRGQNLHLYGSFITIPSKPVFCVFHPHKPQTELYKTQPSPRQGNKTKPLSHRKPY